MNNGLLSGFARDVRLVDLRRFPFDLNGGGSPVATGAKTLYQTVPIDCTLVLWRLMADLSGSIVVDVWADRAVNFPPTVADTVTAADKPTLASALWAESDRLAAWRLDLDAGDVLEVNVDSAAAVTRVQFELFAVPRS